MSGAHHSRRQGQESTWGYSVRLRRWVHHPPLSPQKPKDLEFAQQKLTDKNVGFQMLQKMGWKEGHGLGSLGKGIREPVSVYGMAGGTLGCLVLGLDQSIQPGCFY